MSGPSFITVALLGLYFLGGATLQEPQLNRSDFDALPAVVKGGSQFETVAAVFDRFQYLWMLNGSQEITKDELVQSGHLAIGKAGGRALASLKALKLIRVARWGVLLPGDKFKALTSHHKEATSTEVIVLATRQFDRCRALRAWSLASSGGDRDVAILIDSAEERVDLSENLKFVQSNGTFFSASTGVSVFHISVQSYSLPCMGGFGSHRSGKSKEAAIIWFSKSTYDSMVRMKSPIFALFLTNHFTRLTNKCTTFASLFSGSLRTTSFSRALGEIFSEQLRKGPI